MMNKVHLKKSVAFVKSNIHTSPRIGIILGSGLGTFADQLTDQTVIHCTEIPHYPVSTVPGHAGQLFFGKLDGIELFALKGRVHLYEGYSIQQVSYPVHIMAELGIKSLIVTNAAGGVNTKFSPGDLMLIQDHINFTFQNPLIGSQISTEENRFVDMSEPYFRPYHEIARKAAKKLNILLQEGVLFVSKGPSYETAAEVQMIKILGGDAATMSTVPEVIAANQKGIKVLGLSCISNMATGISKSKLDHEEVTQTANSIKEKFIKLVAEIIRQIAQYGQLV
jgi:purine-nucleoside phosphorylase